MRVAERIGPSLLASALLVVVCLAWKAPVAVAADTGSLPVSAVEVAVDDTQFHSEAFMQAHVATSEWVKFPVHAGMAYRVSLWWTADAGVSTYLCDGNAVEVLGYPGWVQDQPSRRWIRANADGYYYVHASNPGGSSLGGAYTLSVLQRPFSEIASTLAGSVRNAPEGTVAAGASISLWSADSWSSVPVATTTTGADGAWSAAVLPGSYTVRFDDPLGVRTGEYFDHLTGVVGYPDAPTPARIPETTSVAGIDGTLALRGRVVGRIVTSTGGGVGGVTVTSRGPVYDGSAVTGPDGSFQIDGIDSGSPHELSVTRAEGWRIAGGETLAYRIAPGATFGPTLTRCPAGSIAGRVTDPAGDPLAGIRIVCLASGDGAAVSAVTGADGRYRLGDLSAGAGSLSFSDPSGTYATATRGVAIAWGEEAVVDEALAASGTPPETAATFTIAPSAGAHGSISPATTRTVAAGANATFTITPDAGYRVSGVLVDGSGVGAVTYYTFSGVSANHTVSATFVRSLQTLGLTIASDRTISTYGHAVRFYGTTSRNVPNGTKLSFQIRKSVWVGWTTLSVRSTYSGHHWSYTLSTWKRSHGTYYLRVRYTGAAYLPAVSAQKRLFIR